MSPLKGESFLWLVAEEEVREIQSVKGRFSTAEMEATGQGSEGSL